jgi:hypothetical protein
VAGPAGLRCPAWYRAQQDPVVGEALRLVHAEPAHPWTVAEPAARAAVSRSVFARHFTDLVGEPPMSYLACWRLCLRPVRARHSAVFSWLATIAASAVVIGTDATSPMLPTSVLTTSVATSWVVTTSPRARPESVKSSSNGSEAPA